MNIGKNKKDHKDIIAASKALVERATEKDMIEAFLSNYSKILAVRVKTLQQKAAVIHDIADAYLAWGLLEVRNIVGDSLEWMRIRVGDGPTDYIDIKASKPVVEFHSCRGVAVPNDGKLTLDFTLTDDSYQIYKLLVPDYNRWGTMGGLMGSAKVASDIRCCMDIANSVLDKRIAELVKAIKSWDESVHCIIATANMEHIDGAE